MTMPNSDSSHLSTDVQKLLSLTEALVQSGCQLEDSWWETKLVDHLEKILLNDHDKAIEEALEVLSTQHPQAYEVLIEKAETLTESVQLSHEGKRYDALLISAPILAWTRYQLPSNELGDARYQALQQAVTDIVAAKHAHVQVMPTLLNVDAMPQTFRSTRALTTHLAHAALTGQTAGIEGVSNEALTSDNEGILADIRFIVGVIVVPRGRTLFRWQVTDPRLTHRRRKAADAWESASRAILANLFTGCQTQHLCPDAYYTNNREADHQIRPVVMQAAVTWLQMAANLPGKDLRAIITGCGTDSIQEYRIGFNVRGNDDVVYGCVWPLLSREEALAEHLDTPGPTVIDEITAVLKEAGISEVRKLPGLMDVEVCEDCGAPFFPGPDGELQHPQLPDETDMEPIVLH